MSSSTQVFRQSDSLSCKLVSGHLALIQQTPAVQTE